MKKQFKLPELIIVTFDKDDIITTSGEEVFGTKAGDLWGLGEDDE